MFNLSQNLEQRLEEVYRPSVRENMQLFEEKKVLCDEYSKLVFACEKLIGAGGKTTETKVDIGMRFYVNAEIRDTRHVIVRLDDETYAKMTIEKAVEFGKEKMKSLKNEMSVIQTRINSLTSTMQIMLAQIEQ